MLHLSVLWAFFKHKIGYLMVSKKKIHYSGEDEIWKFVPRDHCLASQGKPFDAKQ